MKITKNKFIGIGTLVISGLLMGCAEAPNNNKLISSEIHKVQVLSKNPPKRYYIKFLDLNNGLVTNKYIAKRCSSHSRIKVNEVYELTAEVRENNKGEQVVVYPNAKTVFCPK